MKKAGGFSRLFFAAAILYSTGATAQSPSPQQMVQPAAVAPVPAASLPVVSQKPAAQQLQQQLQAPTPSYTAVPATAPAAISPSAISAQSAPPAIQPVPGSAAPSALNSMPASATAGTSALLSHQDHELKGPFDPNDVIDVEKQITDSYKETSLPNLARAYWAVGAFDWNDNAAIDNYLLITECSLYEQYYNNDFEWTNIRHAAREFLQRNLNNLPTHFEAVIPIKLGTYDQEKGEFAIPPEYQQHALMRVQIETNSPGMTVCGSKANIPGYSRNVIALLDRPFSITSVPVDPRIAQMYLMDTKLAIQNVPLRLQIADYQRIAYLRLKLKFMQFKETEPSRYGFTVAAIYSKVEGWDVYADPQETKPLMIYNTPKRGGMPSAFLGAPTISKKTSDAPKEYMPKAAKDLPSP